MTATEVQQFGLIAEGMLPATSPPQGNPSPRPGNAPQAVSRPATTPPVLTVQQEIAAERLRFARARADREEARLRREGATIPAVLDVRVEAEAAPPAALVPVYREGPKSFWLTPWGQLVHGALCFWLCPLPFSVGAYLALTEGNLPGMAICGLLSQAAWIVPVVLHTRKCLRAQGYVAYLREGKPIVAPPGLLEAHYAGKTRHTTHIPAGSLKAHRPLSSREEWVPAEAWDWLTPEVAVAQGKRKLIGAVAPVAVAGGVTVLAALLGSHALGSLTKLAGGGRRRRR
jgi:hypothetical protein